MLFLTKRFGVTSSDAERDLTAERAYIQEIVEKVLLMQANAAAKQQCPLARGTHAKGTCARAQFEVFNLRNGRDGALARRLARGIFAEPGSYPATVRFANSDPQVNSDFKADVRSLSISVDLTRDGTAEPLGGAQRQDFSLQNATTLPLNDARAFVATMRILTASSPSKVCGRFRWMINCGWCGLLHWRGRRRASQSGLINNFVIGAQFPSATAQRTW